MAGLVDNGIQSGNMKTVNVFHNQTMVFHQVVQIFGHPVFVNVILCRKKPAADFLGGHHLDVRIFQRFVVNANVCLQSAHVRHCIADNGFQMQIGIAFQKGAYLVLCRRT